MPFRRYIEQLLSPIAMFQVFCAVLWLMDEYWQYTIFSIFSVLMLESTTTFQRLRTFSTLHGMCPKPYPLQVYRGGRWQELRCVFVCVMDCLKRPTSDHSGYPPPPPHILPFPHVPIVLCCVLARFCVLSQLARPAAR